MQGRTLPGWVVVVGGKEVKYKRLLVIKGGGGVFGSLGIYEIILILVVVLLIFGPRRLPEIGEAIGKGIKSFKKSVKGFENDIDIDARNKSEEVKAEENISIANTGSKAEEQKEIVGSKD